MAITKVDVDTFISLAASNPIIDVRSPAEYTHAHIPKTHSLPLFNNEERKIVGTAYKKESRQQAIKIGLEIFGKKMVRIVEDAERLVEEYYSKPASSDNDKSGDAKSKNVLTYCWRGGMRSAGVAWLLDLYGFRVYTLNGGYKSFRNWALKQFEQDYSFRILGGYTGSNKTGILLQLKTVGYNVIDLEALANHKGSAFGSIGMPAQPTQEMFENLLAMELWRGAGRSVDEQGTVSAISVSQNEHITVPHKLSTIWLEDESQRVGNVNIPGSLWKQMINMPLCFLAVPFEERLNHIIEEYGKADKEKIVMAILRIKKRLGGLETKTAINYLLEDNLEECFRILLAYYDKWYNKALIKRKQVNTSVRELKTGTIAVQHNAAIILQKYE